MSEKNKDSISNKALFRAVYEDVKPILVPVALCAILIMAAVGADIFSTFFIGKTVEIFEAGGEFDRVKLTRTLIIVGSLLAANSVLGALKVIILNNVVSRMFTCKLRVKMSDKIMRLPVSYVDNVSKGELIEKMTEDVSVVGNTVHRILELIVSGGFQLVFIIVMMFVVEWRLTFVVLAALPFSVITAALIAQKMDKHFTELMERAGELYGVIEEGYGGVKTVRAYGMYGLVGNRHREINDKLTAAAHKGYYLAAIIRPVVAMINKVCYAALALLGGYLAIQGTVPLSAIVAIVIYSFQISGPLEAIGESMGVTKRAVASARRVYGMLALEELKENPKYAKLNGDIIDISDLSFAYVEGKPVLENLNIHVQKGQKIAIVGPTGGGKTTIVNILMRFYDPSSGTINVDGSDTLQLHRNTVRDAFAMVLQETWLFGGTIHENIAYGNPNCAREDVKRAAEFAYCDRFIELLPDGYDTVINENADNISQGQKQLLTIARAFLADKQMLILDEATSNVDTRTEGLLQKAMDKLMENKTCFVIAHRLSTIINADNILVINKGQVIEQGTHKQLLDRQGFYYDMYQSQYLIK